jgi:diadenosine tetraphosphate (Ap4A) HIT family hydrolase
LTDVERLQILYLLDHAKLAIDKEFQPQGYNIGINDGAAAGQTVPHLHVHLIPRYAADVPDPRGGVRWVLPEKAKYWP